MAPDSNIIFILGVMLSLNFLALTLLPSFAESNVYMVIMEDDPVIMSYKAGINYFTGDDAQKYKEIVISRHDVFLQSLLPSGSYTKLYSYTHLLNGFALHTTSEAAIEILRDAKRVRILQEDVKIKKMTTHTPEYLGISSGVWPMLGGGENAGEGVVIGFIDTGINPNHPSFANLQLESGRSPVRYKGKCVSGEKFHASSCNGKIVGAQFFARGAIAAGDFNASRDYASPFDADGHGSHTASTAAGNYRIAVFSGGFNYGYASGMAPAARIAVYKAIFSFGGYMSDVVAAIDQAVEDGVDILSLSMGPSAVPSGPAAFLDILEIEMLLATKAGVVVIQAAGNGGPSPSSVVSFSPWVLTVAASTTDRIYNSSLVLATGDSLAGIGLSPPTEDGVHYPIAAAADICTNSSQNCQSSEGFISSLAQGKLVICTHSETDDSISPTNLAAIARTIKTIGAAGFILTSDRGETALRFPKDMTPSFSIPGIVVTSGEDSQALWEYYDSQTVRGKNGQQVVMFGASGSITDGRQAKFTGERPVVAAYSSRGPDVNNALMQTADVLKPNVMAPGSSIWAAWSPESADDQSLRGQEFALISGTSMATPHVAGVAALIKQTHPSWTPAAISSAIMTTADSTIPIIPPMLAQRSANNLPATATATPFDYGSGSINPTLALDPGLVFDADFNHYIQFLCAVPGVDEESVRRASGIGCPSARRDWCSDLNAASVTVASLVGMRKVERIARSVGNESEVYVAEIREPAGVAVRVEPAEFAIEPNATRTLRMTLEAREVSDAFAFGEVVLRGNRKHVVRIPLAVFVSSAIQMR